LEPDADQDSEDPTDDCRDQDQPDERDSRAADKPVNVDARGVCRYERNQHRDQRNQDDRVAVEPTLMGGASQVPGA
jgi:hypothetical protein